LIFQGGSLWAGVASGAMSQFQHTRALNKGSINRSQYAVHTTENVSGAVGVMAGVEYGALLGTAVLPGFGTAVGAVIGAVFGDKIGRAVGQQTGRVIFQNRAAENGAALQPMI
jgi:outer membrane lipoprotein SlyB